MHNSEPKRQSQKIKHCSTCPFVKPDPLDPHPSCFSPEALDRTVIEYLDSGRVHPCHSDSESFCAGYLSYCKHKAKGGLLEMPILMFGVQLGLIDPDAIAELDTFDSIPEMLASHGARCESIEQINKLFGFGKKSKSKKSKSKKSTNRINISGILP